MSGQHAYLAPSSAHIRHECAAAARMLASYPKPETEESIAGTTAHWVAFCMITGTSLESADRPTEVDLSLIDAEMIEAAEVYYSDIIAQVPGLSGLHLEATIPCGFIHDEVFGTPDAWHWNAGTWTLIVWDFKYGHRFVPAFENWQLIEYVAGILEVLKINGSNDHMVTVDMRVVQPRCYVGGSSVRSWKVRGDELRGYFNTARMFEEKSMNPRALATSNPHCRDCVPLHCVAAQSAEFNAIDVSMEPTPFGISADALGVELRKIIRAQEALKARGDALETQALSLIKGGTAVPGFMAEQGEGRAKWKVPDAEVFTTGDMLGVEISKRVPVTPNQAVKAGVPKELVDRMSFRPVGGLKLVQDDGSVARKVFGGATV